MGESRKKSPSASKIFAPYPIKSCQLVPISDSVAPDKPEFVFWFDFCERDEA